MKVDSGLSMTGAPLQATTAQHEPQAPAWENLSWPVCPSGMRGERERGGGGGGSERGEYRILQIFFFLFS